MGLNLTVHLLACCSSLDIILPPIQEELVHSVQFCGWSAGSASYQPHGLEEGPQLSLASISSSVKWVTVVSHLKD